MDIRFSGFSNLQQTNVKPQSSSNTKLQFSGIPKLPAGVTDTFTTAATKEASGFKAAASVKVYRNSSFCSG